MIIIGEKLTSSTKAVFDAMKERNSEYILSVARAQEEQGADYIDVNTAMLGENEIDTMEYVFNILCEGVSCGISIDSSNPECAKNILNKSYGQRKILINSVSMSSKYDSLIELAAEKKAGIVALPIKSGKLPSSAEERVDNGIELIEHLQSQGVERKNIYVDVLVHTMVSDEQSALNSLKAARRLREKYDDIHIVCGLSNISYGLPQREYINSSFLTGLVLSGCDCAIMDITSPHMKKSLCAAKLIAGLDEDCMDFVTCIKEME